MAFETVTNDEETDGVGKQCAEQEEAEEEDDEKRREDASHKNSNT